jgi:hypothetical protein
MTVAKVHSAEIASGDSAQASLKTGFAFSCLSELKARSVGRIIEPYPFGELRMIVSVWNDLRVLDDAFGRIGTMATGDFLSEVWIGASNMLHSEIESCAEEAHCAGATWRLENPDVARVILDIAIAQKRCDELSNVRPRPAASVEAAEAALATAVRAAADLLASHDSSAEPTKAAA